MPTIRNNELPDYLKDSSGQLDHSKIYSILEIVSREQLQRILFHLYCSDPQCRVILDTKLLTMAIASVDGYELPVWDIPEFVMSDYIRAEAFCKGCPGMTEEVQVAGTTRHRCLWEGDKKLIWCEAYRLVLLDKPTPEEDLIQLKKLAIEAQVNPRDIPQGGYVEGPMFEERKQKALAILRTQQSMVPTDDEFYRIAKLYELDEGLTFNEFKKLYNPERTVAKHLIPEGNVLLEQGKIKIVQDAPSRDSILVEALKKAEPLMKVAEAAAGYFVVDGTNEVAPAVMVTVDDKEIVQELVQMAEEVKIGGSNLGAVETIQDLNDYIGLQDQS